MLSYKLIPCPEKLHPKNNKGKMITEYHRLYNNYPSILHAIITSIYGNQVTMQYPVNSYYFLGIWYGFTYEISFGEKGDLLASIGMLVS